MKHIKIQTSLKKDIYILLYNYFTNPYSGIFLSIIPPLCIMAGIILSIIGYRFIYLNYSILIYGIVMLSIPFLKIPRVIRLYIADPITATIDDEVNKMIIDTGKTQAAYSLDMLEKIYILKKGYRLQFKINKTRFYFIFFKTDVIEGDLDKFAEELKSHAQTSHSTV